MVLYSHDQPDVRKVLSHCTAARRVARAAAAMSPQHSAQAAAPIKPVITLCGHNRSKSELKSDLMMNRMVSRGNNSRVSSVFETL